MLVNLKHNFVMAGEVVVTDQPQTLRTTLGSCAAVIAWHPEKRVGGMSHYLLPRVHSELNRKPDDFYGELALQHLSIQLTRFAPLVSYQIWLSGGGSMIPANQGTLKNENDVAQQNIQVARQWAAMNGLSFTDENTGGSDCRTVSFCIEQGELAIASYNIQGTAS